MKRIIDSHLLAWKNSRFRKPLLLRGARQVGKTHAVRTLGSTYEHFVEINFETNSRARNALELDLDPVRIARDIGFIADKPIIPGKTLLFFDEIQAVPNAITALRYFYENLPEQHIIAAGSLLDFATEHIGMPVGRVSSFYMRPLSFFEFLCARGSTQIAHAILHNDKNESFSQPVHEKLLSLLGEYLAIGGMPEAVERWVQTKDPFVCFETHHTLLDTYRQDFNKYATKYQLKYLEALFDAVPRQLGSKFKYTAIEGEYRKRELAPCLDLLKTAGIVQTVMSAAGNGLPIGSETGTDFKAIFLDVALTQAIHGLDLTAWFLDPQQEFINKGALVEAFVGQELLAYARPIQKTRLFYWRRNTPGSEAEIDYLIQDQSNIIPVEVKSGQCSTLKSMHLFLKEHPQTPYGIRFSTNHFSEYEKIHSYPLYTVIQTALKNQQENIKFYDALCL